MRVFFDRNMPPRLAQMLQIMSGREHEVQHHDSLFENTTPDEEWMQYLRDCGVACAAIGKDVAILRNPPQLQVYRTCQFSYFLLAGAMLKAGFHEQTWRMVRHWPRIIELAVEHEGTPAVFKIMESKIEWVAPATSFDPRKNKV